MYQPSLMLAKSSLVLLSEREGRETGLKVWPYRHLKTFSTSFFLLDRTLKATHRLKSYYFWPSNCVCVSDDHDPLRLKQQTFILPSSSFLLFLRRKKAILGIFKQFLDIRTGCYNIILQYFVYYTQISVASIRLLLLECLVYMPYMPYMYCMHCMLCMPCIKYIVSNVCIISNIYWYLLIYSSSSFFSIHLLLISLGIYSADPLKEL